jgi:hypothetical protein
MSLNCSADSAGGGSLVSSGMIKEPFSAEI